MTDQANAFDDCQSRNYPAKAYKHLNFLGKLRHRWRKRFSDDFGVVDLEKTIGWVRDGLLLVQGQDTDKRNAILRRLYAPNGALRWKKGGFIFTNLIRAMQLEDGFDAQNIKTRILLLKDLADCEDIADVLPVLPNGVITILVYDEDASQEVTASAYAKVIKSMRQQLMVLYSSKIEGDSAHDIVGGTEFQKRRWTIPMVFEESFAYSCHHELHPHLWRAVFATVLMNKVPITTENFTQANAHLGQAGRLISLCDTILLDSTDAFELLKKADPFTELLEKEEFIESFQTLDEVCSTRGWNKPYTSIFVHRGAYLVVRPREES